MKPAPGPAEAARLALEVARLLFANGQTTTRIVDAAGRVGRRLGAPLDLTVSWGEVTAAGRPGGAILASTEAIPTGVDMGRVAATMRAVDDLEAGRATPAALAVRLTEVERAPPPSITRFATMAGSGAAALGVIFGATDPRTVGLIAAVAGAGALVRRWLGRRTANLFVQPLAAALLAGLAGAASLRGALVPTPELVALCPCMVLVPGPHLLNGAIDLARGRLPLGVDRMVFASLVVVAICIGLLGGLFLGGAQLPAAGPSYEAPFLRDALAAGVAVAAYGTFFAMPWRLLPIPIGIGILAHAVHWLLLAGGIAGPAGATFVACALASALAAPITNRLHLPFAAFAFAAVVSLIPGVLLFRFCGGLVAMAGGGVAAPFPLLRDTLVDGATASVTLLAMGLGILLPRMLIDGFARRANPARTGEGERPAAPGA